MADDPNQVAPLGHLRGQRPPAPAWFEDALRHAPQRTWHEVEGARIETLTWGQVGKPGLLLLHGNGAHADWWSFIAPLLAADYRVAALSWSGMGASDWRSAYSTDLLIEEALVAADMSGLFAGPTKPVFVGHSFGGVPTIGAAAVAGERLGAAVMLDIPVLSPEQRKAREAKRRPRSEPKPTRIYRSLEEAVMRFRFLPAQPCEHLFIADHIARGSLKQVPSQHGADPGWTWRFDPFMWRNFTWRDSTQDFANARCPVAVMWGSRSKLITDESIAYMQSLAAPGSPFVAVPEANHHVMVDQPLAFVAALRGLLAGWPAREPALADIGEAAPEALREAVVSRA
jgi:pimeloyl-ACP methyl ester carboxylesterase